MQQGRGVAEGKRQRAEIGRTADRKAKADRGRFIVAARVSGSDPYRCFS